MALAFSAEMGYLMDNEGKPSTYRYLERGCSKKVFGAFFVL